MIKKIKNIIIPALLLFILLVPVVLADSAGEMAWEGLNTTVDKGGLKGQQTDIPTIIGQVVGSVLAFVGIIFFLLIIYGGVLWMTARGNDQTVQKAKTLIESAVVGLVIVLAAYAITSYLGGILTQPAS